MLRGATLRVGTDCSGIEAPLHALQQLGVPYEHVFSSEICPTVRKQLLANHRPQILYEDATARDNSSAPYVDLYVAGYPCQGNSTLGKRRGLSDPRTRVIWSLLDYIHKQRPKVVVLENVANALHIDRGQQFNSVHSSLEDAGYFVHWRILCPKDVGVPMHRRRLYIVGVQNAPEFAWPQARGGLTSLLDIIGPAPPDGHTVGPPIGPRGGRMPRDNWAFHSQSLRERGEKPDEPWLVNVHESLRFAHLLKGECPCLTRKSRPWIMSHGRYLTTKECARLQGFCCDQMQVCVSEAKFRAMLGNSMSVDVLKAILKAIMGALVPLLRPEAPS